MYYGLCCYASPTILILGDSLSAGYGLNKNASWTYLLENKIRAANIDYNVINASVSGATSADGVNTLPKLLDKYKPQILILALGSNDGLQGTPAQQLKNNLAEIINKSQNARAMVLLIGFKIPSNYGPIYTKSFAAVFPELSKEFKIPLVPFLLAGFELDINYFQKDKLHPTEAAQSIMLQNVWPYLQPMLDTN